MKNLSLPIILSIFMVIFSCDNNQNENSDSPLELNDMSFPNLRISVGEDERFEFKVEDKDAAISKIHEINEDLKNAIEEDYNLIMVSYQILMDDVKIVIDNFNFVERNGEFTSLDELDAWECPNGTTQVGGACYSQSCVEENLATAFDGFSSGDTLQITAHHGGAFGGGVKICVK